VTDRLCPQCVVNSNAIWSISESAKCKLGPWGCPACHWFDKDDPRIDAAFGKETDDGAPK